MSYQMFPERPKHHDFGTLAGICRGIDDEASISGDVGAILAQSADPETVMYVAEQRVLRVLMAAGQMPVVGRELLMAIWLDAFMAGTRFGTDKLYQEGM